MEVLHGPNSAAGGEALQVGWGVGWGGVGGRECSRGKMGVGRPISGQEGPRLQVESRTPGRAVSDVLRSSPDPHVCPPPHSQGRTPTAPRVWSLC